MRLYEFAHNVEYKTEQYGQNGFRIHVLSDLDIDRDSLPETYQRIFKYPNQIGVIDIGLEVKGYPSIENVFLAREARRQGLGKMLYTKALNIAKKQHGAKGLSSNPKNRNVNSDAFWAKYSQGQHKGLDIRHDPFEGQE
jgi:GNAT superfamily N-acetyltransferase